MIKIAIVEDDIISKDQLIDYIHQYEEESGQTFKVSCFQDGADIAEDYNPVFDIILMDIEMRFMDGMTAAEHIREVDKEVTIIFVTNMAQYAVRGYAVNALNFLVKPVSYFGFSQCMNNAISRMEKKKDHFLVVKQKNGLRKIAVKDIHYIESKGHDLLIHTEDDTLLMSRTMKDMESKLTEYHFCRCNKGYLVNLEHVNAMVDGMVVVGDDHLIISRPRKKIFQETLANYLSEVIL